MSGTLWSTPPPPLATHRWPRSGPPPPGSHTLQDWRRCLTVFLTVNSLPQNWQLTLLPTPPPPSPLIRPTPFAPNAPHRPQPPHPPHPPTPIVRSPPASPSPPSPAAAAPLPPALQDRTWRAKFAYDTRAPHPPHSLRPSSNLLPAPHVLRWPTRAPLVATSRPQSSHANHTLPSTLRCIILSCLTKPALDLHSLSHPSYLHLKSSFTLLSFLTSLSSPSTHTYPCPNCLSYISRWSILSFTNFFLPHLSLANLPTSVQSIPASLKILFQYSTVFLFFPGALLTPSSFLYLTWMGLHLS